MLFIEGDSEVTLVLYLGSWHVFEYLLWIILSGTNTNVGVALEILGHHLELLLLGVKRFLDWPAFEVDELFHLIAEVSLDGTLVVLVGACPGFSIEELLELVFSIKSDIFTAERRLDLRCLTGSLANKRAEVIRRIRS